MTFSFIAQSQELCANGIVDDIELTAVLYIGPLLDAIHVAYGRSKSTAAIERR